MEKKRGKIVPEKESVPSKQSKSIPKAGQSAKAVGKILEEKEDEDVERSADSDFNGKSKTY